MDPPGLLEAGGTFASLGVYPVDLLPSGDYTAVVVSHVVRRGRARFATFRQCPKVAVQEPVRVVSTRPPPPSRPTKMPTREDMIQTIAIRLGRYRMDLPTKDYDFDDARLENSLGWARGDHPAKVELTDDELIEAWARSERLLRAWA